MNLIPGSTMGPGKSVKGMWAFWSTRRYPNGDPLPKEKIRVHCGRIQKRAGETIHVNYQRVPLSRCWLLPADTPVTDHWPDWESKDLTTAEAKVVLEAIGVENLEEAT